MSKTTVQQLGEWGQSVWLDNISRSLIESGKLTKLIGQGLRGMTSNPTIFDKAVSSSSDYDRTVVSLHKAGKSTFEIYDCLTVRDVQDAADIFKPVYESTGGLDGYVSLEINPELASKTAETMEEGKRLHAKVDRRNVMFKVPATDAGFKAIEELLARGINVNVTLIFSVEQYRKTAEAFLKGMERLSLAGGDPGSVRSVASVFVSRIDTAVDRMIDGMIEKADEKKRKKLEAMKGKAAVANSKAIYGEYAKMFSGRRFQQLKNKGANLQRVLWGSTSSKNPEYSDIKYVSELIAKDTVNTMPDGTYEAFLDHGKVIESVTADASEALSAISSLKESGINIDSVCAKLLEDGVAAFKQSFSSLLNAIKTKAGKLA